MERLILGDNQFFGINHMSESTARAQAQRFRQNSAILEVLDGALSEGVRAFMCTTHDRMSDICSQLRTDSRLGTIQLYPCMPYAQKYNNAVNEQGLVGALKMLLPERGRWRATGQGGLALASRDVDSVLRMLVDAEMKAFTGVATPVIFLQNVVVDLLLGLRMKAPFRSFANHVRQAYGAEPGFITMNLPRLAGFLRDEVGIENPIVCANINRLGFRMCGGKQMYEDTLALGGVRTIAMSVFASGAIEAEDALEYVCRLLNVGAIVFGASSVSHIRRTRTLAQQYWGIAI